MLLKGKRGVIFGVANERSIAWAIAKAADREGARLCITYQNEEIGRRVREMAGELKGEPVLARCDVTVDEEIEAVYRRLEEEFGSLDFIVHSVAYARREELGGRFVETSREGFRVAMEVSVYSLVAVVRPALKLMGEGGSILTLTYLGGERVVPNYNVMGVCKAALEMAVRYLAWDLGEMGIRVNAVSPGPILTLSSSTIRGFRRLYRSFHEVAPLRRNTQPDEVADVAVFLLSDMSRGITGEVIFVDQGYNIMGFYGRG